MKDKCPTCGGPISRMGNFGVCSYCGNKWAIDLNDDVFAVERVNAWSALRDGNFLKAGELFENIILKLPKDHEAYWGKALAKASILYVSDMSETKRVPTFGDVFEGCFSKDGDVQKAISLAPKELAENYAAQAQLIDDIRKEWLEKAKKEPAYDVFLSYKDSDRENGLQRTRDSIDAQDLYNALTSEGYRVFFSRVSLRNKVAEHYEPYIYQAIKTAKVMIVFGEKKEYFSSAWMKNEWSRFFARIEKGEKHKNSLVVAYKDMDPSELPALLRSRQCLNAADITFLSDLTRHIKKVIESSNESVHLEKIKIEGGKISKKAASLKSQVVVTREIGEGASPGADLNNDQRLNLVRSWLHEKQFAEARKLNGEILFDDPSCADALWLSLLISFGAADDGELLKHIDSFSQEQFAQIVKVLNVATKDFAKRILDLLYDAGNSCSDGAYSKLLECILPYRYANRASKIKSAFEICIAKSKFTSFRVLLGTLQSRAVDKYIEYNTAYLKKTQDIGEKAKCCANILSVEDGNVFALRQMALVDAAMGCDEKTFADALDRLFGYCENIDEEVKGLLISLGECPLDAKKCGYLKILPKYCQGDLSNLKDELLSVTRNMLQSQLFDEAIFFSKLVLSFEKDSDSAYFCICLADIHARSEEDIPNCEKNIRDCSCFNKYLSLVDERRRRHCIALAQTQAEKQRARDDEKEKALERAQKLFKQQKVAIALVSLSLVFGLMALLGLITLNTTERYFYVFIIGMVGYITLCLVCAFIGGRLSDYMDGSGGCSLWLFQSLIVILGMLLGWIIMIVSAVKKSEERSGILNTYGIRNESELKKELRRLHGERDEDKNH